MSKLKEQLEEQNPKAIRNLPSSKSSKKDYNVKEPTVAKLLGNDFDTLETINVILV